MENWLGKPSLVMVEGVGAWYMTWLDSELGRFGFGCRDKRFRTPSSTCAQCSVSEDAAQSHSQIRVSMVTWSRLYTGVLTDCLSEGKC